MQITIDGYTVKLTKPQARAFYEHILCKATPQIMDLAAVRPCANALETVRILFATALNKEETHA